MIMVKHVQRRIGVSSYIEGEISRQATFAKRRNGLIKKAFDISMLCGVDVAFIAFSPTGRLNHFCCPSKRIEDVLTRFINLPSHIRQYPIESKEYLVQILNHLKQQTEEAIHNDQFFDIQQEINRVKEQIQRAEARLRNFELHPGSTVKSSYEVEARKRLLNTMLNHIMERKSELLAQPNKPLAEKPLKEEPEQMQLEPVRAVEQVDVITEAKDEGESSPKLMMDRDPSTNMVNEDPQNESTTVNGVLPIESIKVNETPQNESTEVKDPADEVIEAPLYHEPSTEDKDSVQTVPLIPYKPQAIKFNELLDKGKELNFAQTLQEVAPSSCPAMIINTSSTESLGLPPVTTHQSGSPSSHRLIDTPPPNPLTPDELDQHDEALASFELLDEKEEEKQNSSSATVIEHNLEEDVVQSEPLNTSRIESSQFFICSILNEEENEVQDEEYGNVVPNACLGNNVCVSNNDDYNVPVSNVPRSPDFRSGSSSQHQTNNPPSYPITANVEHVEQPAGFSTRNEGESSASYNPTRGQIVNDNSVPQTHQPIVDQNFTQPRPTHNVPSTRVHPQPPIDYWNRSNQFGPVFHNFMQTEHMMPPRPPGHHHNRFMELLNQASVRPHGRIGVNMALQPQFGMLLPNRPPVHGPPPPFNHHPQVLMGHNTGAMIQNQYRGAGPSNYYMSMQRANMEPVVVQNPMEGSSNGRGKRKMNWREGTSEADHEVNSFPQEAAPNNSINQEQQPMNLFGPLNVFGSDIPSLYDPLYEGLGLPIDPHLRMFLAMTQSYVRRHDMDHI